MLISGRTNTILLILILAVGIGIAAMLASGARGGPLDPPAPSASTLPQVEPRSPIPPVGWNGVFPIAITQSGSYFLTRNLTSTTGVNGIDVTSDNVTIDLNGFTLDGGSEITSGPIGVNGGTYASLRVTNGIIRAWGTGIKNGGQGGAFYKLQIVSNGDVGIALGGGGTLDESTVRRNTTGVQALPETSITRSLFANNTTALAVAGRSTVENNHIVVPAGGIGVALTGSFVTINENVFASVDLSGYVTIDFGGAFYADVTRNRIKANLQINDTSGTTVMPYDTNNAVTNISP